MVRTTAVILAFLSTPAFAAPDAALQAELQQRTQALVDAVAKGDRAVWDAALDANVVYVTESGTVQTKAQVLAGIAPLPGELSGQICVAGYRLDRQGPLAVATYVNDEMLDYHGQLVRTRYRVTDSWSQKPGGWKLVASQSTPLLDDPPVATLPPERLADYAGQYELTLDIHYLVAVRGGRLYAMRQGGKPVELKAEATDVFFVPGSPRERKVFLRDASGRVTSMAERREGHDIAWKKVQ